MSAHSAACVTGAGEPDEDEMYESGVLDSNGVYRLQGDKLVPHEDAWASIPSVSLLDSKEVTTITNVIPCVIWSRLGTRSKKGCIKVTYVQIPSVMEQTGSVFVYTDLNVVHLLYSLPLILTFYNRF